MSLALVLHVSICAAFCLSAVAIAAQPQNSIEKPFDGKLQPLPYGEYALEPHMSSETLMLHHGKHTATYVKKLKAFVDDPELSGIGDLNGKTVAEIAVKAAESLRAGNEGAKAVFNNAAQVWNHGLFFKCMKSSGGGPPPENSMLFLQIVKDFGSYDAFREQFTAEATMHFGSGWVWLVWDSEQSKLRVVSTHDADTPIVHEGHLTPLLVCDVWEHAYYVDFRNRRPDYVNTFFDHLVSWEFGIVEYALTQGLSARHVV